MTTYQILYWFDIPLQVRAQSGRARAGAALPERFQVAVDNASMAAGLTGSDDYLEQLHWGEPQNRDGSPEAVAAAVAAELDAAFPTIPWQATAEAVGKAG